MRPAPSNFPRVTPSVYYRDAPKMLGWLCDAFGFELRLKIEGEAGFIEHSELSYGDGLIMVGQEHPEKDARWNLPRRSPVSIDGANTQGLMVYVDDADAHCEHARSHGAKIVDEPSEHNYGEGYWADRSYGAVDPEGHMWWFTQRLRG